MYSSKQDEGLKDEDEHPLSRARSNNTHSRCEVREEEEKADLKDAPTVASMRLPAIAPAHSVVVSLGMQGLR